MHMAMLSHQMRRLWRLFYILAESVALLVPGGAVVSCTALCGPAMQSVDSALSALLLLPLIVLVNPWISPNQTSSAVSTIRWLVIAAAAFTALSHGSLRRGKVRLPNLWFVLFVLTAAVSSLATGSAPAISLLKLALLFTTVVALTSLFRESHVAPESWLVQLGTIAALLTIGSLPMILIPAGYLANGVSFQGLTNEPQALGSLLAPLVSIAVIGMISGEIDRRPAIAIASIGSVEMWLSHSRTSLLGLFVGVGVGILVLMSSTAVKKSFGPRWARTLRVMMLGILVLGIIILNWNSVGAFILKGSHINSSGIPDILYSRNEQIKNGLDQFRESPVFGMGFGLNSMDTESPTTVTSVGGVPVSAPVESGFMVLALLAQTGVVGLTLFVCFLLSLVVPILRDARPVSSAAVAAVICTNLLGEVTIFSPGAAGMLVWWILCWALETARRDQAQRRRIS